MSGQLGSLSHRLTSGELRRRQAKLSRRRARGVLAVVPGPAVRERRRWSGFKALKTARKAAQDAVGAFVSAIVERREAIAARLGTAPRCPHVNVRRNLSGDVVEADRKRLETRSPCAGKMRKLPMPRDFVHQHWRCGSCGRDWEFTNERSRGFFGWIEVYGR